MISRESKIRFWIIYFNIIILFNIAVFFLNFAEVKINIYFFYTVSLLAAVATWINLLIFLKVSNFKTTVNKNLFWLTPHLYIHFLYYTSAVSLEFLASSLGLVIWLNLMSFSIEHSANIKMDKDKNTRKILLVTNVVDTENNIRRILCEPLYKITFCNDLHQAALNFENKNFDLAIIDSEIKSGNGFTLAEAIWKSGKKIPLLMVGNDSLPNYDLNLEQGVIQDYEIITSPEAWINFFLKINKIFNLKKMEVC